MVRPNHEVEGDPQICAHTNKGATTGGSGGGSPPTYFCLDPSNFLDNFFLGGGSNLGGVHGFMIDNQFTYSYLQGRI